MSAWSRWIWFDCGYDCGLISVSTGPAAVVGWYFGVVLSIVSIVMLLVTRRK